eukprot:2036545-Rhodomonas_salina.1
MAATDKLRATNHAERPQTHIKAQMSGHVGPQTHIKARMSGHVGPQTHIKAQMYVGAQKHGGAQHVAHRMPAWAIDLDFKTTGPFL